MVGNLESSAPRRSREMWVAITDSIEQAIEAEAMEEVRAESADATLEP